MGGNKTNSESVCGANCTMVTDYTDKANLGERLQVLYKRAMFHGRRIAASVITSASLNSGRLEESSTGQSSVPNGLSLSPGDWVEVLSEQEIRATLDEGGRHKGLYFMPEMRKYCGRTLRVKKRVENIMLESNREMRKLRIPTVILEDSFCDGESSGGCDRSCYLLWREIWLKRALPP